MLAKCCRCKEEDVDAKEIVVERSRRSESSPLRKLQTLGRERSFASTQGGLSTPGSPPPGALPSLTREALRQLTLSLWQRAKSGITVSVFANGDVSTIFCALLKLSVDLVLTVIRSADDVTPENLTILHVPLRDVVGISEGPNIRLSSRRSTSGKPTADELSCLDRSLQLILQNPVGDVQSICIICASVVERRDMFAGLSVLRSLSQQLSKNYG